MTKPHIKLKYFHRTGRVFWHVSNEQPRGDDHKIWSAAYKYIVQMNHKLTEYRYINGTFPENDYLKMQYKSTDPYR